MTTTTLIRTGLKEKIASSPTEKGLEKLIQQYFCSKNYKIVGSELHHSKNGVYPAAEIVHAKGRFTFWLYKG